MLPRFAIAVIALTAALPAWAEDDVIRLGGLSAENDVIRLGGVGADDADTHLVYRRWGGHHGHWGHGHGHWGGHRHWGHGHWGHGYGGYRHWGHGHWAGGYGGHRHWGWGGHYGGYHRPYYASYYAPYYSAYYRPYVYAQPYYNSYPVYSYSSYVIDPCAGDERLMPEATVLGSTNHSARVERAGPIAPARSNGASTYEYDGGPRQAVPLPDAAPAKTPRQPVAPPAGSTLVSLPRAGQYAYSAYGEEQPVRTSPPDARLVRARGQ